MSVSHIINSHFLNVTNCNDQHECLQSAPEQVIVVLYVLLEGYKIRIKESFCRKLLKTVGFCSMYQASGMGFFFQHIKFIHKAHNKINKQQFIQISSTLHRRVPRVHLW